MTDVGLTALGPLRRWSPAAIAVTALLLVGATVGLAAAGGGTVLPSLGTGVLPLGLPFIVVGVLLTARRPQNPIGWMLAAAGLLFLVQAVTDAYADDAFRAHLPLPGAAYVANPTQWVFAPAMVLGFALPFVRFPDGRLLSPRWRWVGRCAWVGTAATALGSVIAPGRLVSYPADNPLGVRLPAGLDGLLQLGILVYVGAVVASMVAVVKRYRSSTADVRLQMRWFVYGVGVTLVSLVGQLLSMIVTGDVGVTIILLAAMPVCMTIAIMRYRLYDIDRVVSRTVSYVVVTGILVGGYVGLVALTTSLLAFGSSLGVAASTLAAVAAFQPVRRRVQAAVDRRFNRSRYDAGRTVDAFSLRLRDEVDLPVVRGDLVDVVARTVQPAHVSLWLAP